MSADELLKVRFVPALFFIVPLRLKRNRVTDPVIVTLTVTVAELPGNSVPALTGSAGAVTLTVPVPLKTLAASDESVTRSAVLPPVLVNVSVRVVTPAVVVAPVNALEITGFGGVKLAVTEAGAVKLMVRGFTAPVTDPPKAVNVNPVAAAAVRVTAVPAG